MAQRSLRTRRPCQRLSGCAARWAQPRSRHADTLPEIETDTSIRPRAKATLDIILAQPTTTNPYVFPVRVDGKSLQGLPRTWDAMREKAGPRTDATLHILHHSCASLAADLGYGDAVIAELIGHKRGGTTARYTHVADAVVLRAADEVARHTLELKCPPEASGIDHTPT